MRFRLSKPEEILGIIFSISPSYFMSVKHAECKNVYAYLFEHIGIRIKVQVYDIGAITDSN